MPKRNIKKIKEQMKKLQAQMRQAERFFTPLLEWKLRRKSRAMILRLKT